jgi:holo-[acyl-carrier protein] synthase
MTGFEESLTDVFANLVAAAANGGADGNDEFRGVRTGKVEQFLQTALHDSRTGPSPARVEDADGPMAGKLGNNRHAVCGANRGVPTRRGQNHSVGLGPVGGGEPSLTVSRNDRRSAMNLAQHQQAVARDSEPLQKFEIGPVDLGGIARELASRYRMGKMRVPFQIGKYEVAVPSDVPSFQHRTESEVNTAVVVGLGIDIVEVPRIRKALEGGQALAQRVFTDAEREYCEARKNRYQHFAGRFAAKEAALKALGTGWQEGIRWQDVEVLAGDLGKPELRFHGRAQEIMVERGAKSAQLTISHATEYAVAAVVLQN